MQRTYIPTLNGWRAVAVLLVIGAHSYTMLINSGTKAGTVAAAILAHAGIGVDIFFALSGFLICTLLLQEKGLTGAINLQSFYTRRAFRILPPMLVYLAVLTVLTISNVTPMVEPIEIVSSAMFFRNYVPDSSWYAGHFWSLSIEEHFYLFVPLILSVFSWRASLRWAIGIAIACAIVRAAEFVWLPDLYKIEFRTEGRIDAIMDGAIGALLVHRYEPLFRRHLNGITVAAIVCIALFGCYIFPETPVRRTLMAAAIPFPIIFTALRASSLLGRVLTLQPIDWIGRLSYSLYIWQMMFLVPSARQMPELQNFPMAFVCVFGCAIASYYLVERPSIKLGRSIAKRYALKVSMA